MSTKTLEERVKELEESLDATQATLATLIGAFLVLLFVHLHGH